MAVKPEVIKARLKVLLPKANLSQKRLDAYAAKLAPKLADDADETAIDAIITDYNDVIDFEAVAKEDDSNRTLLAKAKADAEKAKNNGGKKDDDDNQDDDDDDTEGMTPFEKKMLKEFGSLKSELNEIKSGNVKQSKLEQVKSLLEKSEVFKKLDETAKGFMLKNVDLESETPFEEQITSLEGVFGNIVQTTADTGQYGGAAGGGSADAKVDQAVLDKMASKVQ